MNEIQRLKQQLDMVLKSETSRVEDFEGEQTELVALKEDMETTLSTVENLKPPFEVESVASQSELEQLRAALEATEAKLQEEHIQTTMKIQSTFEMAEHVKVDAGLRELELESTLQKTKAEVLELKAHLSIATELLGISQINKELKDEMDEAKASQFESEMRLIKATTDVTELKANILDKESTSATKA
ncbi:hypothetical protein IEQ34_003478 [Dendrobium chrysotoxum]|uniref:Uncharacterized protein n=1 Tax=Dendrobium chrysotoxum TaxID=161865 RepID=A0AAV7HJU3_DENCH|nr:hypothetical protein IEQ34_003478 [Dendrobium chrysotoxum]